MKDRSHANDSNVPELTLIKRNLIHSVICFRQINKIKMLTIQNQISSKKDLFNIHINAHKSAIRVKKRWMYMYVCFCGGGMQK